MPPILRKLILSISAAAVALANAQGALTQGAPVTREAYEACRTQDEQAFRSAIEAITVKALEGGMQGFDYAGVVNEQWRRTGMDAVLDARVDIAIDEVRSETSWGGLLQSLADSKKAEELATAVADRVYRSDAVKTAIEQLAVGVGNEVGKRIEFSTQDAAQPAISCLETYLGSQYGNTVSRVVSADASQDFGIDPTRGGAEVSAGAVLRQSGGGITGAAILLVRRQLANMATRIGQRLVGSVLSRLVSVVAGGVGVVLIAKDLWDLRHGVLPIVADEMKSAETKAKVREELANTIRGEIGTHVREIGAKSAEHVIEVWQTFRRAHAKALEFARDNASFRTFLDGTAPDRLPRLDEVVSIVLASEGQNAVLTRLENGTLNEAINKLPAEGMEIARQQRSVDEALQWSALAGSDLPRVVELGLPQRTTPGTLDRPSLRRLLAIEDRLAVTRLASLQRGARDVLLELETPDLGRLAGQMTEPQLVALSEYLAGLQKGARERILGAVALNPSQMLALAPAHVRNAILSSRDQDAAVSIVLRSGGLIEPQALIEDATRVWAGDVSPILLWEKHTAAVIGAAVLLLFVLLMLRRLLYAGRARPAQ